MNGALPMPLVPLRVGLVTSAGSAAYHDFVQELKASGLRFAVDVVDVRVQGAAASRRIVYGLRQLAGRDLDVVVLARGGGSRADLAPFDTDTVARVIAAMPMPVVTGVGHEVDRSVADEVAHTSCKTPTACAQLLVERVRAFVQRLDAASHRVAHRARAHTALARRELDETARRIQRGVPARWHASGRWSSVTRVASRSSAGCGRATPSATSTTAPAGWPSSRGHVSVRPPSSSTGARRRCGPSILGACSNAATRSRAIARGARCAGSATSRPVRRCTPR